MSYLCNFITAGVLRFYGVLLDGAVEGVDRFTYWTSLLHHTVVFVEHLAHTVVRRWYISIAVLYAKLDLDHRKGGTTDIRMDGWEGRTRVAQIGAPSNVFQQGDVSEKCL